MASTVSKILNSQLPDPAYVFRPSKAQPLNSQSSFGRTEKNVKARNYNPSTGQFETVNNGEPRTFGLNHAIIVEPQSTNLIQHASSITLNNAVWGSNDVSTSSVSESVIGGKNAFLAEKIATSTSGFIYNESYSFTTANETAVLIAEKATADQIGLTVQERNNITDVANVEYEFSSNSVVNTSGGSRLLDYDYSVLEKSGPNYGNPVVFLYMVYDPSSFDGATSRYRVKPDLDDNLDGAVLHHAQVTRSAGPRFPISTGTSSGVTMGGEVVYPLHNDPFDFWNNKEGTIYIEYVPFVNNMQSGGRENWILEIEGDSGVSRVRFKNGSIIYQDTAITGEVNFLEPMKIAVSFNQSGISLAVNGQNQDGRDSPRSPMLDPNYIRIGRIDDTHIVNELTYTPTRLPTTVSGKEKGDPISLETLTA